LALQASDSEQVGTPPPYTCHPSIVPHHHLGHSLKTLTQGHHHHRRTVGQAVAGSEYRGIWTFNFHSSLVLGSRGIRCTTQILRLSFGASRLPWSTRTSFTKSRHDFREHVQCLTSLITVSSLRCSQNHYGAQLYHGQQGVQTAPRGWNTATFATLSCERNHTSRLCSVQQTWKGGSVRHLTLYRCNTCNNKPPLCPSNCFEVYHTQKHYCT